MGAKTSSHSNKIRKGKKKAWYQKGKKMEADWIVKFYHFQYKGQIQNFSSHASYKTKHIELSVQLP